MKLHPVIRYLLLISTSLLLTLLAWMAISGVIQQHPHANTIGQQIETIVQFICGVLSLLTVITCYRWRRWSPLIQRSWALSLILTAGLSSLAWGPPMPLTALLLAGIALLFARLLIWLMRIASAT